MNPQHDHFVFNWVESFLDEDGYAIKELSGKIRYFLYHDGILHTSWNKEELEEDFPGSKTRTYTFVPSTLRDNPKMLEANPDYEHNLAANSRAEKAALLDGCWLSVADSCMYFNREWLQPLPKLPENIAASCRAVDKAGSDEMNKAGDYTALCQMHKCTNGFYYITGNFIDTFKDELDAKAVTGRVKRNAGARDALLLEQFKYDKAMFPNSFCVLPVDSGAAGKSEFLNSAAQLVTEGLTVRKDPSHNNKSKLLKFQPFSSSAQLGLVFIIENTFSKQGLEAYYRELENFDPDKRSNTYRKDDWVDASASAFAALQRESVIPAFTLGTASGENQTIIDLHNSVRF